ncbi:unnamed protein product [Arabidopsis thaliana]|nr:unnamed protein product [Arabidopsis thaliana]VYS52380.1 unnamed protein product [Arabidopsis thaliana]
MMMTSIKEREVKQLATTCVAVQGLLYALQLIVLEAAPDIQEGPQIDEVVGSDSDEDPAVVVGPRQVVALKLGNAKDVDAKCEYLITSLVCGNFISG